MGEIDTILSEPDRDTLPSDDRAFLFGDGLFETLLAVNGRLICLDLHLERLVEGARRLRIPMERDVVADALDAATPAVGNHALRLTLSRGSGPRGYRPGDAVPRIRIRVSPLDRDPRRPLPPAQLAHASVQLAEQPLLAGLKHCNRLEQVMASMEAADLGVDDVVLRNSRGTVQCAGAANLFVLEDNRLITPDCQRSGIAGTRRRLILETIGPAAALDMVVDEIDTYRLRAADAVFICNAIIGLRAVERIDAQNYQPCRQLEQLQELYFEHLRRSCDES